MPDQSILWLPMIHSTMPWQEQSWITNASSTVFNVTSMILLSCFIYKFHYWMYITKITVSLWKVVLIYVICLKEVLYAALDENINYSVGNWFMSICRYMFVHVRAWAKHVEPWYVLLRMDVLLKHNFNVNQIVAIFYFWEKFLLNLMKNIQFNEKLNQEFYLKIMTSI